jgi:PD-(D/E)XK nuclease superfamily protein
MGLEPTAFCVPRRRSSQLSYSPEGKLKLPVRCHTRPLHMVRMGSTPSQVGARAELEIAAALIRSGRRVYLPLLAPDDRVDLVYDDPERGLIRAQCKTARVVGAVLTFKVCSNTRNAPRDYRGEVDVFAVYSPQLGDVFLVPVADVGLRGCHLRLDATRNNQARGIRWAEDYRLREREPVPG